MKNKAYIVANEQQEREVLKRLEKEGCSWNDTENTPPTEWHLGRYPYAIFVKDGKKLVWGLNVDVSEVEIVAEDKQDKVKISKEVYDALVEWKEYMALNQSPGVFINEYALSNLPKVIDDWWGDFRVDIKESNNRLIAIIRWVNGEDVFEVEKPKKWVVRSKETDEDGDYHYVDLDNFKNLKSVSTIYGLDFATKFDAKEEAQSWANAHQEVVEVVDV